MSDCPDYGMVDPVMGYWNTPCTLEAGHTGPHIDSEGFSRYPLTKRIRDLRTPATVEPAYTPDELKEARLLVDSWVSDLEQTP